MALEWILLFLAGTAGGVLNSIAGGGSFITFPALLACGVPPIAANATNTFAVSAGYLSGAYGFRHELRSENTPLLKIVLLSSLGGVIGALLLLNIPDSAFLNSIPWLLAFATMLFMFGEQLQSMIQRVASKQQSSHRIAAITSSVLLLLVSAYGGFFNAGLGIVALSYLVLAGYQNIHLMNGLKLVISSCVSISAIGLFLFEDVIDWNRGGAVLLGTLVGGYVAARVSRGIPAIYIRRFVACSSCAITLYFFFVTYR
ncbi:sulfite exporter TauE/SafE family protein [Vibrio sp. ZSDE26]|uniref:Probable membrane transporter protein n=1 Tax=Vibrio amylolyticus TaxID=2847292 RepID=A0A9X1XMB1_9VIBR|nr:sulfite exporter TauE/SafE family protein [Vibrio amylolyticus]MCK6264283.1 sulfite exporter TauE/SafE family protein [Vibrio amylolyticus]